MKVALGVSGGIACYKAAEIVRRLQDRGFEVVVLMTKAATQFVTPLTFRALSGNKVYVDMFEGEKGADFEDDFLTTMHLAVKAPLVLAPAMNTRMWEHPSVQANLSTLVSRGARVIPP